MFDDADFEALRADQTARFTLHELHIPRGNPKPVTLLVKHAGESNDGYARGVKNLKFRAMSEEESTRAVDQITARYVIVGWEDVLTKAGTPIAYTNEGGLELLTKLRDMKRRDWINALAAFCGNGANFTAASLDPGDLGNG